MVTCCNDNLEDDILQPSADKIVCMPKIIHHVVTVEAKSSFHLHDILVTDGSVRLLLIVRVMVKVTTTLNIYWILKVFSMIFPNEN